jgi:hypothetical protein
MAAPALFKPLFTSCREGYLLGNPKHEKAGAVRPRHVTIACVEELFYEAAFILRSICSRRVSRFLFCFS